MPQTELTSQPPNDAALQRTIIDDLLDEQQRLTAVERFSRRHEEHTLPAHARYYRDLIPRSKPGEGQQYAFAVDMDACTGCKGCVSACHSLNGLDEDELWRNVGLLHSVGAAYQQTITTACHHCVDPACMNGCPVLAYDKDPITGIVRHLDDQCIGCQYCVLKCPYEVPKYSRTRGIVRKCDMCSARLADGEAPACVQACPNGAITIGLIDRDALRVSTQEDDQLLPGTVSSAYTFPTSIYRTRRVIPLDALAGASEVFQPQEAHWPLIFMLLLTQMGVGLFAVAAVLPALGVPAVGVLALAGTCLLHAGLAVSTLHLGRPSGAWRAFLGLRRSWMSREIVVFGALAPLTLLSTVAASLPLFGSLLAGVDKLAAMVPSWAREYLLGCTALIGGAAVFCSGMIYIDTRRPSWKSGQTLPKFLGTTALLGTAGAASLLAWLEVVRPSGGMAQIAQLALLAAVIRAVLFGREIQCILRAFRSSSGPRVRGMSSQLRSVYRSGAILFLGATIFGIGAAFQEGVAAACYGSISVILTFLTQVCERYLYFVASVPFRMPGTVSQSQVQHP